MSTTLYINGHILAIKLAKQPVNIKTVTEDGLQTYTNPTLCKAKCDSDTNCVGWVHRDNTHGDVKYKNTCINFTNDTSKEQYNYGFTKN